MWGITKTSLDDEVPILPADKLKSAMKQHNGLDGLYLQVLRDAPYSANPDFMHIFGALCLMPTQSSMTHLAMFLWLKDSDHLRQLLRGCKSFFESQNLTLEQFPFLCITTWLFDQSRSFSAVLCWSHWATLLSVRRLLPGLPYWEEVVWTFYHWISLGQLA